jgi:exonuclease III
MDISILSWNVCGLNERARRDAVHTLIDDVRPCIVCLQEAKLGVISQFYNLWYAWVGLLRVRRPR